jgi:peptidyl-prolyl cis-trans isomerase A (cyclophilin A)
MRFLYRPAVLLLFSTVFAIAQQATPPETPQAPQTPAQTPPAQPPAPAELPDMPVSQAPTVVEPTGPTVVLDTSMGRITCRFFDKEAPITVANFIGLAQGSKPFTDPVTKKKVRGKPFFDGTTFHRVIPEFMIQGGDPTGTGTGDPGYMFADEFDPNLNFDVPGRMAMANSGPGTNGSQFFITEVPTQHLNQKHTIFGQCDESSMPVVSAIARVQRDPDDKPLQPVTLDKVTIVREGKPLPPLPPGAPAAPVAPASAPAAPPIPN